MTVEVGAGRANKQRRLLAVDRVISRQFELAQAGAAGELMLGEHMFNALTDEAELLGLPSGERYYQDPGRFLHRNLSPTRSRPHLRLKSRSAANKIRYQCSAYKSRPRRFNRLSVCA